MSLPSDQNSPGRFAELSEAECQELLAQHTAGRVGFMAPDGPQILPVTYQFRNGGVIFRTSPAGALSGLIRRTSVAFEIDDIDEQNKSGWSVLVLGFAEAMAHNHLLTSAWETGPVPWADGVRNLFIEIKPRKISGRSVGAAPVTDTYLRSPVAPKRARRAGVKADFTLAALRRPIPHPPTARGVPEASLVRETRAR